MTGTSGFEWRRGLTGPDPSWWVTRGSRHTIAVVVESAAPGQPLLDVARLAGADPRLRVVLAAAPGPSAGEVEGLLRGAGAVVLPWREAVTGGFGLVVAAASARWDRPGAGPRPPAGPRLLLVDGTAGTHVMDAPAAAAGETDRAGGADGAPVVVAVAHEAQRSGPGAWGRSARTAVVGDATHDRLVASLPLRGFYRRALGVADGTRLVVVALTAGRRAHCRAGGRCRARDVVHRLLAELPAGEYRLLGVPQPGPHPDAAARGMARHLRDGLGLMPAESDWRAALVAADFVVGDGGPVACYGAVIGVPVLLAGHAGAAHLGAGRGGAARADGPAAAALAAAAPRLSPRRPVPGQLTAAAVRWRAARAGAVARGLTSEPGGFHRNVRRLMYGMLRLPQPATIPVADPVSPPFLVEDAARRRAGSGGRA